MEGSPVPSSTARVETLKPSAYLKQFCKHFAHKSSDSLTVQFDDSAGRLWHRSDEHGEEELTLHAIDGEALVLEASAETPGGLRDLEGWAGDHLVRFGRRDELQVHFRAR